MKEMFVILFFLMVSLSCSARQEIQCGDISLEIDIELIKTSELQVNWGEGYSCSYEELNKERSKVSLFYRVIELKNATSSAEELISEFYANEQNIQNDEITQKVLGKTVFYCFSEYDVDFEKKIQKCFTYRNNKLYRLIYR